MSNEYMHAAEVAQVLKLSRSQITRKAQAGTLPVVAKAPGGRGAYFFDRAAVLAMASTKGAQC